MVWSPIWSPIYTKADFFPFVDFNFEKDMTLTSGYGCVLLLLEWLASDVFVISSAQKPKQLEKSERADLETSVRSSGFHAQIWSCSILWLCALKWWLADWAELRILSFVVSQIFCRPYTSTEGWTWWEQIKVINEERKEGEAEGEGGSERETSSWEEVIIFTHWIVVKVR